MWSRSAELIEQRRQAGSTADQAEHTSGRGVSVVGQSVAETRELVDREPVTDAVRDHEHGARLGAADREQLLLQLLLGDRIKGSLARLAVGLGGLPKQPLKTRVAERLPLRIASHRHHLAMGAKRKGERSLHEGSARGKSYPSQWQSIVTVAQAIHQDSQLWLREIAGQWRVERSC